MKLIRLTPENKALYHSQIVDLEQKAEYPYGDHFFKIDHGKDYFAFFERQGKLDYYMLVDKNKVAGVVAAVLRDVPSHTGIKKIWYYCDLKIHPDYRGRHLPIKMAYKIYLRNFLTSWNGFGISMNPASGGHQNRMKKLIRWLRWIPVRTNTQLNLFSLDKNAMQKAQPILEQFRGKIRFLSLEGIKDLILTHDQSKIPILHAQFGKSEALNPEQSMPQEGCIHMFCIAAEDPLVSKLAEIQILPFSTMTLFNYGKNPRDWNWLMTSDL
ncbi:hypothetical protein ACD661_10990 [Legionella lytica]|uniref:N-acetyltransferase domain-containing protein n=1 Tax=Legionella lytica TaxID=96232 RepID=A0ABW8DCW9_9GAMM